MSLELQNKLLSSKHRTLNDSVRRDWFIAIQFAAGWCSSTLDWLRI